jgi:hypothetical protein
MPITLTSATFKPLDDNDFQLLLLRAAAVAERLKALRLEQARENVAGPNPHHLSMIVHRPSK